MEHFRGVVILTWLLACMPHIAVGAERDKNLSRATLDPASRDYRLGGGDLIEISAYGVQTFQHTVRVSASGVIRIPLLGEITVAGKTESELETDIENGLKAGFIQDPTVSVFVKEYKSRSVFVLGSVRVPGQYQVVKQLRLIDVITMAGGLAPDAGDELLIQRKAPQEGQASGDGEVEVIRIDLPGLLTGSRLDQNVAVEDGDVVTVPQEIVDYFYVIGEVHGSGAFPLPEEGSILVSQALARAGGTLKTAKLKKAMLVRYDDNQVRHQTPVNFPDIFRGEAPDLALRADDILFVPGSGIKSFGYAMLQGLPQTAQRAVIIR